MAVSQRILVWSSVSLQAPGETSLIDGVSDALLGVPRQTAADPQELSGGEGGGQRLRLGETRPACCSDGVEEN